VIILVMVTYHLGDEAGQGFLHGFAGIMVFVVALAMLFVVDKVLGMIPYVRERPATVSR
jgi:exosortase/archaeosortase family protein